MIARALALLIAAALSWPISPPCGQVYLGLAPVFPPDPAGTWHFEAIDTAGPWLLCFGPVYDPTAHPAGVYKGCDFWPGGALVIIGPFVGDLFTTFVPPGPMHPGCWQIITAGDAAHPPQTSNGVCAP